MDSFRSVKHIRVLGDVIQDHHIYEGEGARPGLAGWRGVNVRTELGGAKALQRLLRIMSGADRRAGRTLGYVDGAQGAGEGTHAYALWRSVERGPDDGRLVWRARLLGYNEGAERPSVGRTGTVADRAAAASPEPSVSDHADILVIHDANLGFRTRAKLDFWLDGESPPAWIVLRMSSPLGRGDLWQKLVTHHADRLICIVSAADLRGSHSAISVGLSWERTLTDVQAALKSDPILAPLARCRVLTVCFAQDAALAVRSKDGTSAATLVFDPKRIEGEFAANRAGDVTGHLTCMTAAMVSWLTLGMEDAGLADCLRAGLSAMRDLIWNGHGPAGRATPAPRGFPAKRLAKVLVSALPPQGGCSGKGSARRADPSPFAEVALPWSDPTAFAPGWTILLASQRPTGSAMPGSVLGLAKNVVTQGLRLVLASQPHVAFGNLQAFDWREIESLRGIQSAMLRYRADLKPPRPLAIGVFGPPGAGKSFGVKEIAREVFGGAGWLEFNLSQFEQPEELKGPFHQVRDLVLSGLTPVVFWDEFDSKNLFWLQYLIGPMQDGRFQDKQLSHSIGKAVFVFAGGTCPTFSQFDRSASGNADFRDRKGPDFVSRLDAYLDVVGPNPRDVEDLTYPIRRAQIIRHHLGVSHDQVVDVDSDLLNALLLVPRYRHGSRSIEKLVKTLRGDGTRPICLSALPARETLDLSVDPISFASLLYSTLTFRGDDGLVEKIAAKIHENYRRHMRQENQRMDDKIDKDFKDLGVSEQEDNRAAARRTFDVLALIGMGVALQGVGRAVDENEFEVHAELHLERLAEAEHDGWKAHRVANGWSFGPKRDYTSRLHPGIRSYAELPEADRSKDRAAVRSYWSRIDDVDLDVVWLEPPAQAGKD